MKDKPLSSLDVSTLPSLDLPSQSKHDTPESVGVPAHTDPVVPTQGEAAPVVLPQDQEAFPPPGEPPAPPKRGRGRPRKDAMSEEQRARLSDVVPNPNPPPLVPLAPKKITRPADYENLGNMAASLWFSGGETIFGDEWRPNPAESDGVPKAFTAYFRAKEIGDIPPGVALCLALGTYSVARITRPTVKARFVQGWLWVKGRWSSWRRGGR